MKITCPHCEKPIELVGAAELKTEYGLTSNSVQHYKTRGFPEPVLTFGNRHIYLRSDVERFVENRSRANVEKAVDALMRDLEHLPNGERATARRMLEERLFLEGGANNTTTKPRSRRRK